jgi:hypothetical protein
VTDQNHANEWERRESHPGHGDHDIPLTEAHALSPEDQDILDSLVEAGFDLDVAGLGGQDLERGQRLVRLFGMLDDYPVEEPHESLVDATMARIDQHERQAAQRLSVEFRRGEADGGGRRPIRIPDLISVAAVILIVASIAIPLMAQFSARADRMACADNMRLVGYGFAKYSADNNGELPLVQAGIASTWTSGFNNIINLRPLVEGGYCERGHLTCPGHDGPDDAFSYQFRGSGVRLGWHGPAHLILSDRNPVIDGFRTNRSKVSPLAVSVNHGGRGQNVLSSDGTVLWLEEPIVASDNIWLPDGVDSLQDEVVVGDGVFLAN